MMQALIPDVPASKVGGVVKITSLCGPSLSHPPSLDDYRSLEE